ncbi:uncharacterized protein AC631_02370 [Debaryomyces fabryi]|uniref:Phosphoglycerate mutase n=1 Tax=Debaryomyces fabryi TaxID=58627 RepID=A0A0V1Q000_9ASCO|nr:uncharacterized protein AC631_02370 [Debaryomyces fabryi]KSA01837.1 hypothetical protein AC631_02370 [Debaryomyces fabryi]CUM45591.1 unnamed protein product [Debaryomyces fabryi]
MSQPSKLDVLDSRLSSDDADKFLNDLRKQQEQKQDYWKFEIVPNYFKQSDLATDETTFNYLNEHFGRVKSWENVFENLDKLNEAADSDVCYKVFFLARHGQGYHNLAHDKYGNDAWNDYWSKINGDGEIVWGPDPELTELGQNQAKENYKQWQVELKHGCRLPTRWFVSPLSRSIDTLTITWENITKLEEARPLIKENIRETIGVHTCDKRSTRSIIDSKYSPKGYIIEPGFAEEDVYFKKDYRETVREHAMRINEFFQEIFTLKDNVICVTSHSGSIRASLLVLGHRQFSVGTGGMIPVFVKGTKIVNK